MANPTVKEMVKKYLEDNGYCGLYDDEKECGCDLNNLMPCHEPVLNDCKAGYKAPCDCGDHDYHIVENKPQSQIMPGCADVGI